MKEKVDTILTGDSFFIHLMGVELGKRGQNFFMINDSRLQFGELIGDGLFELEKTFLKTWGEDRDIEPLFEIENYLTQAPYVLCHTNMRILLGNDVLSNLRELCRKLPKIFSNKDGENFYVELLGNDNEEIFSEGYYSFIKRAGVNLFRYKNLQNLTHEDFLTHCPQILKELFHSFSTNYYHFHQNLTELHIDERNFFFFTRGFIQNKFSHNATMLELFHLLLSLLSPYYQIGRKAFAHDMRQKILSEEKRDFSDHFIYEGGKDHNFTLEADPQKEYSFEKGMFFGHIGKGPFPLQVITNSKILESIGIELSFEAKGEEAPLEFFIIESLSSVGADFFVWFLKVIGNKAFITIPLRSRGDILNTKEALKLIPFIKKDLAFYLPQIKLSFEDIRFFTAHESFSYEDHFTSYKKGKEVVFLKNPHSFLLKNGENPKKAKKCDYFGVMREGPLGVLSLLMDLKEHPQLSAT